MSRIALLSPCFWPEVRRGGERFTRELADGLLARGESVELITSHPGPPRRANEDGLAILRLPRPPQGRLLRRYYEPYLTHVPLTYVALRSGRYELAHAVYPTDALAAARWRRRTGRPAVLTYLGIPDFEGIREFRRRREVLLRALEGCSTVVALSRYAAEAFRWWLGYDAPVIPPGVDLDVFRPGEVRAPVPTILCSAAAAEPRKHVPLLVSAFAQVRERYPDAQLVLSRSSDQAAVQRAGVPLSAPGVVWRDLDDRAVLARACAEAWVSVLPAENEAFGLVIAEALACGTPVVGYAGGAIPELIDRPSVGRLFETLEPDALAGALLEALELSHDPETASACRLRAEGLSVERCTEAYLELYARLGA